MIQGGWSVNALFVYLNKQIRLALSQVNALSKPGRLSRRIVASKRAHRCASAGASEYRAHLHIAVSS